MRHRASRTRLPWWVHVIVLSLILGSTAASVLTGNPLYALVGCPGGYALGAVLTNPRHRAALRSTVRSAVRNRVVWLVVAGLAFATAAATVATLAVTR